tara:strand:+ start:280 stop:630 length:351 start_codon:yes stop_codon:yes gene_type:complete
MIKTELKSEKVELALELGGIKTMSSALKGSIKSYNRKFETLDDLVGDLQREAKELDKRADKFFKEVDLIKKEGEKQASDLGVKFSNTPIGKEVNSIETSILTGELATIKQGLKIKI